MVGTSSTRFCSASASACARRAASATASRCASSAVCSPARNDFLQDVVAAGVVLRHQRVQLVERGRDLARQQHRELRPLDRRRPPRIGQALPDEQRPALALAHPAAFPFRTSEPPYTKNDRLTTRICWTLNFLFTDTATTEKPCCQSGYCA